MSKYLISFGYPMGFVNKEELVGIISTNDNTIVLNAVKYAAWQLIFKYGMKEEFTKEFESIFENTDTEKVLNKLKSESLIIELDDEDDLELCFNNLKDLKLYRQGFGMGVDPENNSYYKIAITNYQLRISLLEYIIWSSADNKVTIEEIYNDIAGKGFNDLKTFILLILNLYQENLLYIMR